MKQRKYDWQIIQADYDSGLSLRDLTAKYGVAGATCMKAVSRGELILRSKTAAGKMWASKHSFKHTEETKQKISKIRRDYLEANPDKVPYRLNHSSKRSYPELLFETALSGSNTIECFAEFRNGIYQYDFAFPKLKLDIEIDGGTHTQEAVRKIDERRDKWSVEQGWTVLRFSAIEVKRDVGGCLNVMQELIETLA